MVDDTKLIRLSELSFRFQAFKLGIIKTVFFGTLQKTHRLDRLPSAFPFGTFFLTKKNSIQNISFRKSFILGEIFRTSLARHVGINISVDYVLT